MLTTGVHRWYKNDLEQTNEVEIKINLSNTDIMNWNSNELNNGT